MCVCVIERDSVRERERYAKLQLECECLELEQLNDVTGGNAALVGERRRMLLHRQLCPQ